MPPPSATPKPPQKLEFTKNSLRNTTLSTGDDSLHFEIVTRYWHPNLTKINKFDMESRELVTVAEIEGLQTREPACASAATRASADCRRFDVIISGGTFQASSGVEYRWKTHRGRFQKAVAEFHPHTRHFFVFRMSKHAFFEVQPIPEITDAIEKFIVSYLLVERRRRDFRIRVKLERH
ncbi:hypothetical protein C8Q74DRAFT_1382628 [Fomes fomentarius]|nr:hypothetical protein C8Q74DRAFT_1382628 [Fomes fomentarius]